MRGFCTSGVWRIGLLLLLAVASTGCRLDVSAVIDVAADGSADVELAVELDEDLLEELDRLGVDPTAELAAVPAPRWEVERRAGGDGGLTVTLHRSFDDAAHLGPQLRELTAGLADDDPAFDLDLDIEVDADGASVVEGRARLQGPADAGVAVDGDPVGPGPDELAEQVADAVEAAVTLRLPGAVATDTAGAVDGRSVTWQLGVDEEVEIAATGQPPATQLPLGWVTAGLAAVAAAVVAVVAVVGVRRRRLSRAG